MSTWDAKVWVEMGGLSTIRKDTPDDLFLTCASDEPRTLFSVEHFTTYKANRAVIYYNREMVQTDNENQTPYYLNSLGVRLNRASPEVVLARGSFIQSELQLDALKTTLVKQNNKMPEDAVITVDTTTFNRDALLTAVELIRTARPKCRIRALYTSPKTHGSWLTRGYREVRNILGFAGIQRPSQATLLIILSGFEPERALKLIEEHEPVKILLGTGNPPVAREFLVRNLQEQEIVLARQEIETFDFPATSIKGCYERINRIIKKYIANYNIVIAPMSTKLSTLGVLLAAEKHPEVQLTYCVPGEFNTTDYSTGVSRIFSEDLPIKQEDLE